MKVVRFANAKGYEGVGLLEQDRVLYFGRAFTLFRFAQNLPVEPAVHSIHNMLLAGIFTVESFGAVRQFIQDHNLSEALTVADARLLAPIPRPPRIVALGRNYAAHAAETGAEPPSEPIFFLKASTSVIGPDEPVVCPKDVGRVDHEVELAVIVGKSGRRISREEAPSHIAGYTILNDVTARDMQSRDLSEAKPWFLSKSPDTFGPMGPCIALPDEIPAPCELDLCLRVNGDTRQESNTRNMIFDVPELIHRLSRYVTLEPGDVISTGTPEGIGPVVPGDIMEAEVERIGVLRNPVAAER